MTPQQLRLTHTAGTRRLITCQVFAPIIKGCFSSACVFCLALLSFTKGRVTSVIDSLTELAWREKKKKKREIGSNYLENWGCAPGSFTLIEIRYLPLIRVDPRPLGLANHRLTSATEGQSKVAIHLGSSWFLKGSRTKDQITKTYIDGLDFVCF